MMYQEFYRDLVAKAIRSSGSAAYGAGLLDGMGRCMFNGKLSLCC